jgi:hypothetical protein
MLGKIRENYNSVTKTTSLKKQAAAEIKRRCIKCHEEKSLVTDFYMTKNKLNYEFSCKSCRKREIMRNKKVRLPGGEKEIPVSQQEKNDPKPPGEPNPEIVVDVPKEQIKKHYTDFGIQLPDLLTFDWDTYKPGLHYSTAFLSARNTGKTTLLKDFYKNVVRKNYDLGVLFCNSLNASIYEFLTEDEKRTAFGIFNKNVLQFQEEMQKRSNNYFHFVDIWDDCIDFNSQKNADEVVQIYVRGRNSNTSICFSTQAVTAIAKPARGNIDFLFFGRVNVGEAWEQVVETLFRGLIGFDIPIKLECQFWHDLIHTKFEPYTFLVIDFLHGGKLYKYNCK